MRAKERRRETAAQTLAATLGRAPTAAELAEALGVQPHELDADSHDVSGRSSCRWTASPGPSRSRPWRPSAT